MKFDLGVGGEGVGLLLFKKTSCTERNSITSIVENN